MADWAGMTTSPTEPLRPVAIVDIDGVVADVRHRVGHLEGYPPDWGSFFSEADLDPPLPTGVARVRQLVDAGHEIMWLTGRPEWLRRITRRWLLAQGLPVDVLLMRPNGDRRPARSLKSSFLRAVAEGRPVPGLHDRTPREIALVVDDDDAVVARLRADGFPVEQADWLDLSDEGAERLASAQQVEGRT